LFFSKNSSLSIILALLYAASMMYKKCFTVDGEIIWIGGANVHVVQFILPVN